MEAPKAGLAFKIGCGAYHGDGGIPAFADAGPSIPCYDWMSATQ